MRLVRHLCPDGNVTNPSLALRAPCVSLADSTAAASGSGTSTTDDGWDRGAGRAGGELGKVVRVHVSVPVGKADLGSIEPGKRAELLAIQLTGDVADVEQYLVSGIDERQIEWVSG